MDENKDRDLTAEDIEQQLDGARNAMENAKAELIRNIFQALDYHTIFTILGQEKKYSEFAEYVKDYAEKASNGDNDEPAKPWTHFIDADGVTANQIGQLFDYSIMFNIMIAVAASQTIETTVYDTITAPQFNNVQGFLEQAASTLGAVQRSIESLSNRISVLENDKKSTTKND